MSVTSLGPPAAIEPWEVLDLLTALVQKSLVVYEEDEQGQGRYRLLETVRQYGRDRLVEADEVGALRERHAEWFLRLAEEAEPGLLGPDQARWLDRIEAEHDNLRAALDWTLAGGEAERGLRAAAAVSHFWAIRDYGSEGRDRLASLLALPEARQRSIGRAKALHAAGHLLSLQGDREAAVPLFRDSLEIACELDYESGIALSLLHLGGAAESLVTFRQLGDKRGMGVSLCWLALAACEATDYERARSLCEEALTLLREQGEPRGIAFALGILADIAYRRGQLDAARSWSEARLAILREIAYTPSVGGHLRVVGMIAREQGDLSAAERCLREALLLEKKRGDWQRIRECLEELAKVAERADQLQRAARLLGTASVVAVDYIPDVLEASSPARGRADEDFARVWGRERRMRGEQPELAAAWAEGRAMSLEDAVRYALEEAADA